MLISGLIELASKPLVIPVTTSPTLLQLAQQGDPGAIARLLSQVFNPRGIQVKTNLKEDCLQILLESEVILGPEKVVPYLHHRLTRLSAPSICTVRIYGRQSGHRTPTWSRVIRLPPNELLQNPVLHKVEQPQFSQPQFSSQPQATQSPFSTTPAEPTLAPDQKPQAVLVQNSVQSSVLQPLTSVLLSLLRLQVCLDSLFFLYLSLWAFSHHLDYFSTALSFTEAFSSQLNTIILISRDLWQSIHPILRVLDWFTLGLMLVWLYRLHRCFQRMSIQYPITPGGAIARYIVPLYNLVGIWQIFTTLATHPKIRSNQPPGWSGSLRRWLFYFYIGWMMSLAQEAYRLLDWQNSETLPIGVLLLFNGALLLLSVAWLQLVRISALLISAMK